MCAPEHTPNIQGRRGAGVENCRRDPTLRDGREVSALNAMCATPGVELVLETSPITAAGYFTVSFYATFEYLFLLKGFLIVKNVGLIGF